MADACKNCKFLNQTCLGFPPAVINDPKSNFNDYGTFPSEDLNRRCNEWQKEID